MVYADIVLKNAGDVTGVHRGFTKEEDVRKVSAKALVDTGTGTLVINEDIRRKLGLEIRGMRRATLANDAREMCKVTEPVEIHWKDRETVCPALVVSGAGDILLGAIPLEDMDLIVDPVRRELAGAHGDEVVCLLK
jgi:clan AA aspartic protease